MPGGKPKRVWMVSVEPQSEQSIESEVLPEEPCEFIILNIAVTSGMP